MSPGQKKTLNEKIEKLLKRNEELGQRLEHLEPIEGELDPAWPSSPEACIKLAMEVLKKCPRRPAGPTPSSVWSQTKMLTRSCLCTMIVASFSCAPSIQEVRCPVGANVVVSRNFDTDCGGKVFVHVNDKGGALDARCASVGKTDYACKFETKLSEICAHGIKTLTRDKLICSEPPPVEDFGDADREALQATLRNSELLLTRIDKAHKTTEIRDLLEARVSETFGYTRVGFEREFALELAAGRQFYGRYLKQTFPELPGAFFVKLVRVRARESQAPGTQIEVNLVKPAIAVFWNSRGYCDLCTHGRDFAPPRYTFFVDPVYATRWFDMFILTEQPIGEPKVNVSKWKR